jgi:CubicO group peptidase (beta-lactamase class C family)
MQTPIHGTCDAAFHAVRDAFQNNFIEHGEIGASVYITVNGVKVVDLWGGFSNPEKTSTWQEDQLVNAFSIGKGVTAVVAAQCVANGLVSYETRVASLWPEFAVQGKEELTLRDLLGHRAGLPAIRKRLAPNAMFDWKHMTDSLASEEPWWTPGTEHGYHVNTYGFLVGEMLRRATGKSVGRLISEYIAGPLQVEIYLGTPVELHSRIADYEWPNDPFPEQEPAGLNEEQLLQFNTYYNPSGLSGAGVVNSEPWRLAEMPSTNVHASARAISILYTSLAHGGTHDNVSLLPKEVLNTASSEVSNGDDRILHRTSRFAHGFQLPIPERGFGPNPESFGHFGAGGSVGFCDPKAKVGFGYVMNQMGPRWQNPRNRALIDSLYSCLQ